MMVARESFRSKKSGQSNQKRAMLLIKRTVWNVGNHTKKGSWEQATVGLMLFRCDYAGSTIIFIIIIKLSGDLNNIHYIVNLKKKQEKSWSSEQHQEDILEDFRSHLKSHKFELYVRSLVSILHHQSKNQRKFRWRGIKEISHKQLREVKWMELKDEKKYLRWVSIESIAQSLASDMEL